MQENLGIARRSRVDLSLKHGLMVWVIDGWPIASIAGDANSGDLALARLGLGEEEAFELVTA
jgi:hypothetical protein